MIKRYLKMIIAKYKLIAQRDNPLCSRKKIMAFVILKGLGEKSSCHFKGVS